MCALSGLFAFFAPGHLTRVVVARLGVDTNEAERRLRPLVIVRTVSDGTRSDQAADTRLDLASVFQTWHAHGLNPFAACYSLLHSGLPQLRAITAMRLLDTHPTPGLDCTTPRRAVKAVI